MRACGCAEGRGGDRGAAGRRDAEEQEDAKEQQDTFDYRANVAKVRREHKQKVAAAVRRLEEDGMVPVWGPQPYNTTLQTPIGPKPPHSMADDAFTWGVGEEADLITLLARWALPVC